MSYKHQGRALTTPILQPRTSRFNEVQTGFDSGSRTFKVDADSYLARRPGIHTADSAVKWTDHTGAVRAGRYRTMFVVDIDVVEETNNIITYTVNYLGVMGAFKRPEVTTDSEAQYFVDAFVEAGVTKRYRAFEVTPSVTVVHITAIPPKIWKLGQSAVPAGFLPPPSASSDRYYEEINAGINGRLLFADWILKSQSSRQAGSLHEITRTYVYERVRSNPTT